MTTPQVVNERIHVRIGELASWAGISSRAVRHYHRVGLLAEPARTSNGYREYTVSDLVQLLRIRRLTDLGLRLQEVHKVLAETGRQTLRESVAELDRHLAAQQLEITRKRERIACLRDGEDNDPAQLAGVVDAFAGDVDAQDVDVELESWLLATVGSVAGVSVADLHHMTSKALGDLEQVAAIRTVARRFAALADADADEPEVARLADDIAVLLKTGRLPGRSPAPTSRLAFSEPWAAELSPAQARCLELMVAKLRGGAV